MNLGPIVFSIIRVHPDQESASVEVTGSAGSEITSFGETVEVHDPPMIFLNEPMNDLVGRKGIAHWINDRWQITALSCPGS